jgi:hypothetical protein
METDDDSKTKLIEALRQKARSSSRSKTARLREIFDDVEASRADGVSHKQIVVALASQGLIFTEGTYLITRHRIAKERKESENQKSAQKAIKKNKPGTPLAGATKKEKVTRLDGQNVGKNPGVPKENEAAELVRPPGITNGQWSEIQAKAAAAKRKKTFNSGE